MRILLKLMTLISTLTLFWSCGEIVTNHELVVGIGELSSFMSKSLLFLPYLCLILFVIKLIYIYKDLKAIKAWTLSSISLVLLIVFDLFFSGLSLVKNSDGKLMENNIIQMQMEPSLVSKESFLLSLKNQACISDSTWEKVKPVNLTDCKNYTSVLDDLSTQITKLSIVDNSPGFLSRLFTNIGNGIANHPFLTLGCVIACIGLVWFYREGIYSKLKTLSDLTTEKIHYMIDMNEQLKISLTINKTLGVELKQLQTQLSNHTIIFDDYHKQLDVLNKTLSSALEKLNQLSVDTNETRRTAQIGLTLVNTLQNFVMDNQV